MTYYIVYSEHDHSAWRKDQSVNSAHSISMQQSTVPLIACGEEVAVFVIHAITTSGDEAAEILQKLREGR